VNEPAPRADVRRHREAILAAAAAELRGVGTLEIQRVAARAGISRSTVHRHYRNVAGLERALAFHAAELARRAIEDANERATAPLADVRRALTLLARIGARCGLARLTPEVVVDASTALAAVLGPAARRVLEVAAIEPPPESWLDLAVADLATHALRAANADDEADRAAEDLFSALTDRLDRALVVVDRESRLITANAAGRSAFGIRDDAPIGSAVAEPRELRYEDDTPSPPGQHPFTLTVSTGRSQPAAIRGQRANDDGHTDWFVIETAALRLRPADPEPYGVVAALTDISESRRRELAMLAQPGTLGRSEPVILDAARALDQVPAHLLPDQLVAEARRLVNVPVALYVVDIDGSHLLRLAGTEEFPEQLEAPLALGPELAPDGIPELAARLATEMPGTVLAPLWLRGRAVGVLLAAGGGAAVLAALAREGAAALELGNGYTDVLDARRRRKEINPAAEIQQSLLPPRIVRLGSGQVASSMLPAYEVGGDWFDYVENRDGAWLAIADAAGKGARASALGSLGLAALRAARRNGASLDDAVQTMHETLWDAGEETFYLTTIVARWSAPFRSLSWVNAGHPPPLVFRPDGSVDELRADPDLPLGLDQRERRFGLRHRRIAPHERIVLYTDGISNRPTRDGLFGRDGIIAAVRSAAGSGPSAAARAIQVAVVAATTDLLRDDAAVIVFDPDG
jgi:AcrR family transcriptional regulator